MANIIKLRIAGESNIGLIRKNNEDCFGFVETNSERGSLAVVADGVGGHIDGDLASMITTRELVRNFLNAAENPLHSLNDVTNFFKEGIAKVNKRIFRRNLSESLNRPMCTTLVAAAFFDSSIVIANIGDSRMYEFDRAEKELMQLTVDHSAIKEYRRNYGKPIEDPETLQHAIAKAIGTRLDIEPDIKIVKYKPDSIYFLCTDGCYRYLKPEKTVEVLAQAKHPREALNFFMRESLISGGNDNITIIMIFPEEK